MFFSTFAWSFVYVSLPFHIQAMSPGDAATTLRWTGWILLATTVLAWTSAAGLYLILAAVGLACVPLLGSRALGVRAR